MAGPPATPAEISSFLTMFLNNGFDMLPGTVGEPNDLDCIIPSGFITFLFILFSKLKPTAAPNECRITVSISW